jgi:ferrous iron transport protein B
LLNSVISKKAFREKGKKTSQEPGNKVINIAVAGNPNSGKSTLINAIAGSRLHVGNWAGVTVEKKTARFRFKDWEINLVDLPGIYSLSPFSQEEIIARDFLINEKVDIILNVVDATNLERNLYLTLQLLELEIPLVMALNIYDEASEKGFRFDLEKMAQLLGIQIVPTVSTKKIGLDNLFNLILELKAKNPSEQNNRIFYGKEIEDSINLIKKELVLMEPALAKQFPRRWLSLKLMEGDEELLSLLERVSSESGEFFSQLVKKCTERLRTLYDDDLGSVIADARYALVSGFTKEVLVKEKKSKRDLTEKIDRVVLNKYLGIPVFLASMWLLFKLTFDLSAPFVDWIDKMMTGPFTRWLENFMNFISAPGWLVSLAAEGILAGVGFVLVFVPVIFAMMFFISFLEGSGYMARAAFVMDRAMHAIGLHGRSFIPMLLGFGCNVPAIYATRTLENNRDRILTALLIPMMSCGARLPVYVVFIGAFFAAHSGTMLWFIYLTGIVVAIISGLIFKNTLFKGDVPLFIMELPPYRVPALRSLLIQTWEKGKHFLYKAGTYIMAVSILVWFLLNLPWGVEDKKDSYLGKAGQAIAPIFKPLGFGNWQAASSLITGLIAKEVVVGTMGEIYVGKKETVNFAPLARFPDKAAFQANFKGKIEFLPGEKKLKFISAMSDKEFLELNALSADKSYRQAVAELYEKSRKPSFAEDAVLVIKSFGGAVKDSFGNIFASFGIESISAEEDEGNQGLKAIIQKGFTPLSAFSFMVFVLLYMPCVIVLIALKNEFGSWKWPGFAFAYGFTAAWIVSFAVYQSGKLLGFGG